MGQADGLLARAIRVHYGVAAVFTSDRPRSSGHHGAVFAHPGEGHQGGTEVCISLEACFAADLVLATCLRQRISALSFVAEKGWFGRFRSRRQT